MSTHSMFSWRNKKKTFLDEKYFLSEAINSQLQQAQGTLNA